MKIFIKKYSCCGTGGHAHDLEVSAHPPATRFVVSGRGRRRVEDLEVEAVQVGDDQGSRGQVLHLFSDQLLVARFDHAPVADHQQQRCLVGAVELVEPERHALDDRLVGFHAFGQGFTVTGFLPPADHPLAIGGDAPLRIALGDGAEATRRVESVVVAQHGDGQAALGEDRVVARPALNGAALLAGGQVDGGEAVASAVVEQPAGAGVDLVLAGGSEDVVHVDAVAPGGDFGSHAGNLLCLGRSS